MQIPKKVWKRYSDGLAKVSDDAKALIIRYIESHDVDGEEGRDALIRYAYGISTKYGEAAAAYACQMYDAITEIEKSTAEPAEPAETATYSEVAKAVNGTMKYALVGQMVGTAVGRLVKMAGQDTTLKNAIRDRAYFAWIPEGDTCVFCLMIAAEGWKRATAAALSGGHAEHIHGNCNCSYAIRHDSDTQYASYKPEEYQSIMDEAEGRTETDKLNYLRRQNYAENKEEINEQKRMTYRARVLAEEDADETNVN